MVRRPAPADDRVDDAQLDDDEIVLSQRSLTFCGKTFPVTKSASRSRSKINGSLDNVPEEAGVTADNHDVIGVNKKNGNYVLPPINKGNCSFANKRISFTENNDNRSKIIETISTSDLSKLSAFESGVTTPDGKLILSREDYDAYMERYRQAMKHRLYKQRRKSETLDEQVRKFKV